MHPKKEYLPLLRAFSNLCQKAYCSWHLVANPVLAKVGLADLFQEYLKGGVPPRLSKLFLLNKLIRYYVKGFVNFILLLCYKIAHVLSAQSTVIPSQKTVFIDAYFLIPSFLKGADALENYFPGIRQSILDAGWEHVILPRFYGTRSPLQFYRMFHAVRASKAPILTEFQILTWQDYLQLLKHTLIYPWLVFGIFKYIPRTREGLFLRFALAANGLDDTSHIGAIRYLMGRRLAPLLPEQGRCLQWFENQTYERCFNRGLREAKATMPVYGAQLFLWPPEMLNIHVDNAEVAAHKPDIILVNGPYYKHEKIDTPCKVGPSLRYARLFETFVTPTKNKKNLVLLSYFEEAARFAIKLALQCVPPEKLMFKFHPDGNLDHLNPLIPPESVIVEGELYDIFHETGLLIGSASGALVEAAAVGIPVIVASMEGVVGYSYLPDIGRGVLWEAASNACQFQEAKAKLLDVFLHKKEERLAAIETLRAEFFIRPTSESIVKALDLLDSDPPTEQLSNDHLKQGL